MPRSLPKWVLGASLLAGGLIVDCFAERNPAGRAEICGALVGNHSRVRL
jgi:hypothetical protein